MVPKWRHQISTQIELLYGPSNGGIISVLKRSYYMVPQMEVLYGPQMEALKWRHQISTQMELLYGDWSKMIFYGLKCHTQGSPLR
jgi:hypothetical protein